MTQQSKATNLFIRIGALIAREKWLILVGVGTEDRLRTLKKRQNRCWIFLGGKPARDLENLHRTADAIWEQFKKEQQQ